MQRLTCLERLHDCHGVETDGVNCGAWPRIPTLPLFGRVLHGPVLSELAVEQVLLLALLRFLLEAPVQARPLPMNELLLLLLFFLDEL